MDSWRTPLCFRRVQLCIALVVALSANRAAADWPQWRGPKGDGYAPSGAAIPRTLPDVARYVWKVKVGDSLGSPVVSGGRLFHLDQQDGKEVVHALDAATGKPSWSMPLDEVHKDHQSPGPRSTPTVDGDRLYVQSCRGEFRCLSVADGRTLWRVNFVSDFAAEYSGERGRSAGASRHGYSASPLVVGERIFVGVGGRNGASIVCFDKRNGTVVWKSQSDAAGYGGPTIARIAGIEQVLAFTAEAALGLRSDTGALLWRVPVKTSFGRHVASPVVMEEDLVIVGSHQAGTMALKITGESEGCKAETAWLEKRIAINFSSPVLVDGHLYGMGPAGQFYCADARTGEPKWTIDVSEGGLNAMAQCVVLNRNILVLSDSGELLLIPAEPEEAKVVSRLKVAGETWCNPAYVDGRLFLRDKHELMCVDLISASDAP